MKEEAEVFARIPIKKWKIIAVLEKQGEVLEAARKGRKYFDEFIEKILLEYKENGLKPEQFDELKYLKLSDKGFQEMLEAGILWPVGNNSYREITKTEGKRLMRNFYKTLKSLNEEEQKNYIAEHREEASICAYQEMKRSYEVDLKRLASRIGF